MTSHAVPTAAAIQPPRAGELVHLRPTDAGGLAVAGASLALTGFALLLSAQSAVGLWLAGQVLLAIALVQWFAILHECGHETLFRTRALHAPLGHVAAFFSLIPFHNWRRVHARHHKWTGWQDVDPTTSSLAPRPLNTAERVLVNVCWRWWIPIFSVIYRVNNYWHVPRLRTLFPKPADRRLLVGNIAALATTYVALAVIVGPGTILRLCGLALVLCFAAEDLIILSQHTHVPQELSHGADVRPFPAIEQEVFTRSLRFPPWLSALLLHIDAHELHHMYPFVPGYRLRAIAYEPENEIDVWSWLRGAKRLTGEVFLFQNRHESGADI